MALSQLAFTQTAEADPADPKCVSQANTGSWGETCSGIRVTSTNGTYNGQFDVFCTLTSYCHFTDDSSCSGTDSGGNTTLCNNASYSWLRSDGITSGGPWPTNCVNSVSGEAVLMGYLSETGPCSEQTPVWGPAAAGRAGPCPNNNCTPPGGFLSGSSVSQKKQEKLSTHTTPKQIQKAK